jgi:hypothetical protein
VTMLEGGSAGRSHMGDLDSGVPGATGFGRGSATEAGRGRTESVSRVVELEESRVGFTVSRELAGDPEREVRRRLRDEMSLSSKGFGRVELASAEAERSGRSGDLEVGSIGVVKKRGQRGRGVKVQRRHTVTRDAPAIAAQN